MLGQTGPALPRIRVGVAAMDKKARSKPMQEIVARLQASGEFEVRPFGDDGRHVRAAVGVSALPRNAIVEIQMTVRLHEPSPEAQ